MGGESLVKALSDFQTIVQLEPLNTKAQEGVESVQASIGLYQAVKAKTDSDKREPPATTTTTTLPVSGEQKTASRTNAAAPTTKTTNTPLVNAAVEQARGRVQIPSTPPKTSFEIEKVRRECAHDLMAWGEYLSNIKPKSIKKIFGSR